MPYRKFRRNLTIGYLSPFIIGLALLAAVVLWRVQNQALLTGWVEHSDQVLLHAKDAEVDLRNMQVAYRGYLLAPSQQYLGEMSGARAKLTRNLNDIAALVADNPEQEQALLAITEIKEKWSNLVEQLLRERDRAAVGYDNLEQVRPQAQKLFVAIEDFIAAERQLRMQRVSRQQAEYQVLFVMVPLLSILVMAALSYWGWRQIQLATVQFHQALEEAERSHAEAEKARSLAEKANRAKDNFLSTVSHELRNPLNSILLWSTALLRDKSLTENSRRGVTAIERAVRVQSQLIEDLLDISRIESGRLRLDVQTVDLAEVVKAGVESMRAAADAKSITLQEIIDPRVDTVAGDPGRLQQVVWNLVSNAVKFTPKGGRIQVRCERINSHIEIIVADSGQGIEASQIGSVFERFWQGSNSDQSKQGVGLGLSIVKELVGLHGGSVAAHSEGAGKGSIFTVRLPLPASSASRDGRRHPAGAMVTNSANPARLDGLTILVIDDDRDTCEALKNLLGALGATVVTATSARAALTVLDDARPDAVISDIGMPVEDGYFLARELRKREREGGQDSRMPLIALTAYGRVEDKVEILTAGFDSHAIKPVDPVELSAILRTCIAARRGATTV